MAAKVFSITELRRTGAGLLALPTSFRWSADSHTAPIGTLSPPLRVSTTREEPTGSQEVIEQVTSVAWQPFSVRGHWNDNWAGKGFAKRTFEEFRKMVARAPLVRMEMSFITLQGLITEFVPAYHNDNFIEWSFTFSPHRFGDDNLRPGGIVPPTVRPTREHVSAAEEKFNLMTAAFDDVTDLPFSDESIPALGSDFELIDENLTAARFSVDQGLELDPISKLRSLAARFRGIRDTSQRAVLTVGKMRSDLSLAFNDAIMTLRFDVWVRDTAALGRQTALGAHEAEKDCHAQANARPRAIHRPYKGESLAAISLRYYGTPKNWRLIYQKNRLDTLELNGTEELVIPERAA